MTLPKWLLALVLVLALPASALSQGRPIEVRTSSGSCGEPHHGGEARRPTELTARSPRPGRVTITLARFSFYCSPAPRFEATLREDGTIELRAREPEPPVARCICDHTVQLELQSVPPGPHAIEARFREDVVARGRVDVTGGR